MSTIQTLVSRNGYAVALALTVFGFLLAGIHTSQAYVAFSDQTIRIAYTSSNIQPGTCSGSGGYAATWAGAKADNNTQTFAGTLFPLGTTYTYNFGCLSDPLSTSGGAFITGTDMLYVIPQAKVQVAITKPGTPNPLDFIPTLTLTSTKSYVFQGGNFNLSWNYSDLSGQCIASGAWTGVKTPQSIVTISWSNNSTIQDVNKSYTLTCTSPGKNPVARTVTVTHEAKAPTACKTCQIQ